MAKEVEVMDFMNAEKEGEVIMEVKKQNKVVKKYKELKTWQKVTVWVAGAAVLAGAGYGIYKFVTPDVVTDLAESAVEAGLDTVTF